MSTSDNCPSCGSKRSTRALGGLCQACVIGILNRTPSESSSFANQSPSNVSDECLGRMVGRYRLIEKLGEGGAGIVYAAEQETPVRRRVALKLIKLGMDTRSVITRFEAERQALAMMDHPHIAKVLDAGSTTTGRPYFVMELVEGSRITQFCDEHQSSISSRLELFITVCQAVQHAHQKAIIHRDLKPSNILVSPSKDCPAIGSPKIIDFGIAKAMGQELTESTLQTDHSHFLGTPAYMSPEQVSSNTQGIDTRSDIYSLGVLLYELLTGQLPIEPNFRLEGGKGSVERTLLETDPPRPSTRLGMLTLDTLKAAAEARSSSPVALTNHLRGDLDWIAMKCLEKDRDRRYETPLALAEDLRRHLQHEPVIAGRPSAGYVFRKFARRNRAALVVCGFIAGLLLAATTISSSLAIRATKAESLAARRLAESEKSHAESVSARQDAEAIAQFLTELFQSPHPNREGRKVTVAEILQASAAKLDSELVIHPNRKAKLQAILGETYHALGMYREGIAILEKSQAYFRSNLGADHPTTLQVNQSLARSLERAGRSNDAIALLESDLRPESSAKGQEQLVRLQAMQALATTYRNSGRHEESLALRRKALSISQELLGPDHPDTLIALQQLAESTSLNKNERLAHYESLYARTQLVHGKEHLATLEALTGLATAYQRGRRYQDALNHFQELIPLSEKLLGEEHPTSAKIRAHFRKLCLSERRFGELDSLLSTDLKRARAKGLEDPISVESSLLFLCWLNRVQGRFLESESQCQEVIASTQARLNADRSLNSMQATTHLGTLYADWAWVERTTNQSGGLARANLAVSLLNQNLSAASVDPQFTTRRLAMLKAQLGNAITVATIANPSLSPELKTKALSEAETLMLESVDILHKVRRDQVANYREVMERLIRLYESTGNTDRLLQWRNRYSQFDQERLDHGESDEFESAD